MPQLNRAAPAPCWITVMGKASAAMGINSDGGCRQTVHYMEERMNLQIITREEIAEIYGVRPQTISDWASQGKFPKPLPGGNYRWSAKAVEHFMVLSSLPDEAVKKAKVLAGFEVYGP